MSPKRNRNKNNKNNCCSNKNTCVNVNVTPIEESCTELLAMTKNCNTNGMTDNDENNDSNESNHDKSSSRSSSSRSYCSCCCHPHFKFVLAIFGTAFLTAIMIMYYLQPFSNMYITEDGVSYISPYGANKTWQVIDHFSMMEEFHQLSHEQQQDFLDYQLTEMELIEQVTGIYPAPTDTISWPPSSSSSSYIDAHESSSPPRTTTTRTATARTAPPASSVSTPSSQPGHKRS